MPDDLKAKKYKILVAEIKRLQEWKKKMEGATSTIFIVERTLRKDPNNERAWKDMESAVQLLDKYTRSTLKTIQAKKKIIDAAKK